MGLIVTLIIGGVIGWLASLVMKTSTQWRFTVTPEPPPAALHISVAKTLLRPWTVKPSVEPA